MEDFKRILVVSRSTKYCQKAVDFGISLARRYEAKLFVIHVVHNPFNLGGWNLPVPSLEKEYEKLVQSAGDDIERMIKTERTRGIVIEEIIRKGEPVDEVLKTVKDEKIDLLIMLAHEEGRIEHFLFGRANEELVRKMPCHIMLVKKEPERVG